MLFKILYEMRGSVADMRSEITSLRKQIDEARSGMMSQSQTAYMPTSVPTSMPTTMPAASSGFHSNVPPVGHSQEVPYDAFAQEIHEEEPENLNLTDLSRIVLEKALERNHGNRKKAAQDLGISDRTLYRRLQQFGLAKR